jgi:O-antigen/teichoic acid export membrane protein
LTTPSLKQRTASGLGWSSAAHLSHQAIQFGIGILLARLLTPEDFGLVGMVIVFSGFARLFAEFGFSSALVQRAEISELHQSSIFWVNLIVGFLLGGIFFLLAPYIAAFYVSPPLLPISQVVAATFVISGFGIVPRAMLQRRMAFDRLARIEVSSALVAGAIAVALAFLGFGVWSLVVHSLAAAALTAGLALILSDWVPRFKYSNAAVRQLLGYSANLFAYNFVNYWSRNTDNLLVAKMIGSAGLGVYARAYSFMLLPITQVLNVVGRVIFPALASVQEDRARVRRIFLRVLRMVTLITAPMMAGLFVVADVFILTVLGAQWAAVIPVLQILCAVGILQTLCNPVGWIYQSQGRTDLLARWGLASSAVIILAVFVGASLGTVEAVAWSYLIANVVLFYPCLAIPGKIIDMTVGDVVGEVSGVIGCAVVMAGLVWGLGSILPAAWPGGLLLTVQVFAGIACYSALIPLFCRPAYEEARSFIREQRQRHRLGTVVA